MTVPMKVPPAGDIMESVIAKGNLSLLEPEDRVRYYNEVCRSMGLNPLTQPFSYITLNGKLTLYATRTCADQLRKINNVSLEIVSREIADDILTVHVRARMPDGRSDEELGAVPFPGTLKGEARANAELKAVTKAKRRATLSICGLGWLDETEVEDIPASAKRPARPAPNVMLPAHNPETGEVTEVASGDAQAAPSAERGQQQDGAAPNSEMDEMTKHDETLSKAAELGTAALSEAWAKIPKDKKPALKAALDRRHKVRAAERDQAAQN